MKKDFFSDEVSFFLKQLGDLGWNILLVGGSVRDQMIGQTNSHDYDFELRGGDTDKLLTDLKRIFKEVEVCDFAVFKAHLAVGQLEFALPRTETYQGPGPFSHSDFTAKVDPELTILESFKRRDFTFNAMAYSVEDGQLAEFFDPFFGQKDLAAKCIDFCDEENFFKDPVRLLRAVRFSRQFSLAFSSRLVAGLSHFDLSKLTPHHLFTSAFKNNPIIFFRELWKIIDEHHIVTADFISSTRLILDLTWQNPLPYNRDILAVHLAHKYFAHEDQAMPLIAALGVSPGHFRNLVLFWQMANSLDINEIKQLQSRAYSEVTDQALTQFLGQWQRLQRVWTGSPEVVAHFLPEQICWAMKQIFTQYLPSEKEEIRQIVEKNQLAVKEIWKIQLLYRMKKLTL